MSHLTPIAAHIQKIGDDSLWTAVRPSGADISVLLSDIPVMICTPEEFMREIRPISREQARMHLVATLRRTIAYKTDRMPLQAARALASAFLTNFEEDASFFSTCDPLSHDQQYISHGHSQLTDHTFESILYCIGSKATALIIAVDED